MINLLPPKEKQILVKERKFREILILGSLLFCFLFLLSASLFLIKLNVQNQALLNQVLLENKKQQAKFTDIENLEKEIASLNKICSKLSCFCEQKYCLIPVFESLNKIMPNNIYLTNLSFTNKEQRKFSISGFAGDRNSLSEFKTNLEKQENFQEIYFPASNWLKSFDIDFFVSFKHVPF